MLGKGRITMPKQKPNNVKSETGSHGNFTKDKASNSAWTRLGRRTVTTAAGGGSSQTNTSKEII
jgi:hypothetical protein